MPVKVTRHQKLPGKEGTQCHYSESDRIAEWEEEEEEAPQKNAVKSDPWGERW